MAPGCFLARCSFGYLEVRRTKTRGRRADDSAPVFRVPGNLAYPLRRSRGLQRPPLARAWVTSLTGAAPVLPAPRHTHTGTRAHLRKGETESGHREDPPAKVTSGGARGQAPVLCVPGPRAPPARRVGAALSAGRRALGGCGHPEVGTSGRAGRGARTPAG